MIDLRIFHRGGGCGRISVAVDFLRGDVYSYDSAGAADAASHTGHAFNEIVRDKLLRCTVLVVCSKHSDATTNAEVGLAKKYSKVLTTLDGVLQAAEKGKVLTG